MPIKSAIKIGGAVKTVYPVLKQSTTNDGLVVLFINFQAGTVMVPSGSYCLGEFHNSWSEENFVPVAPGTVIEIVQE